MRRSAGGVPGPRKLMRNCRPALVATALLLGLALQCADLRAELLFRAAEQRDGAQQWSALRRYANPANSVYPRTLADGTQLAADEVQVFLQGDITPQDAYAARVMESLIKRGRQKIAGNRVSLEGGGGDVDAAMEIGRVLRRLGVATIVERGNQCLSSCVFAFMGGSRRMVEGRIGIHRPYLSSTRKVPDRPAYYRQLQQRLRQYVDELDFPRSLYEALMAVPPESISILTAADLKKFYLQGMSPSTEDEADATAARGLGISVLEYLQQKAQAEPCAGVFVSDGGCARNTQNAEGRGAAAELGRMPFHDVPPPAGSPTPKEKASAEAPGEAHGAVGTSEPSF